MVRFSFKQGLRFLEKTRAFTPLRRLANGSFQLEDEEGEACNLTEPEIHKRRNTGEWQIDEESLGRSRSVFYVTTATDLKIYLPTQHSL